MLDTLHSAHQIDGFVSNFTNMVCKWSNKYIFVFKNETILVQRSFDIKLKLLCLYFASRKKQILNIQAIQFRLNLSKLIWAKFWSKITVNLFQLPVYNRKLGQLGSISLHFKKVHSLLSFLLHLHTKWNLPWLFFASFIVM